MKKYLLIIFCSIFLASCGASKKKVASHTNTVRVMPGNEVNIPSEKKDEPHSTDPLNIPEMHPSVNGIINTALSFHGTRYKYGGTTKKGMDCSGLVYTSFQSADISLQRSSAAMATQGEPITITQVRKGDLLFFTTGGNKKRINHVGLVVEVRNEEIRFIHATTSRGVMVSSLREGYWNHAFHHARRIL